MKTALVIGATGLVGSHLVEQLAKDDYYGKIIILSRRNLQYLHPKKVVQVIDFDHPDETVIKGDHVFCAIGTTIKKAGSKENQYRIDCEYPYRLAEIAKKNGAEKFVLVSSIGANAKSGNFYLRTKGDLEEKLKQLHYNSLIILRPSFILGNRKEFRLGEKVAIGLFKILTPLMVGGLKRYRGVQASAIAAKMISEAKDQTTSVKVVDSASI
jgi:uncharacterized protein YbjT (DUF2867 family)